MQSPACIYKVGYSKWAKTLLSATPLFRAHELLSHTFWGSLDWIKVYPPHGKLLAPLVHDWREIYRGTPPPGLESVAAQKQVSPQVLRTMEKVLVGLHKAHAYKVDDLIAGVGWG